MAVERKESTKETVDKSIDSIRPARNDLKIPLVAVVQKGIVAQWWEILGRLRSSCSIGDLRLLPNEYYTLQTSLIMGFGPLAAKYLCWRKTILQAALVPFIITSVFNCVKIYKDARWDVFKVTLRSYLRFVEESHASYFQTIYHLWVAQSILYACCIVITSIAIFLGISTWTDYRHSRSWVRLGYTTSFVVPFVVLLLIPFRQSVDFKGLTVKICQENFLEIVSRGKIINLNLSDAFCYRPISEWVPDIEQQIKNSGMLINETTRTCENAVQAYQAKRSAENKTEGDTFQLTAQECLKHSQCAPCFKESTCVAMAAVILYNFDSNHKCVPCYQRLSAFNHSTCMEVCRDAYMPQLLSATYHYCVPLQFSGRLQSLTGFLAQIDYAQFLVGAFVGATAIQTLFPSSLSLLFGAIRGARVTKEIASWSRLPGYAIAAAIIFCLPMLCSLLISLQQLFGDHWSLLALIFLYLSVLIWFPLGDCSNGLTENDAGGLLQPQSLRAARNEMVARGRISFICKLACIILCLVFMAQSDIGQIAATELQAYLVDNQESLLSQLSQTISLFFLDIFGRSLLSTVVFSDICLDTFRETTAGDLKDSKATKFLRRGLASDIDTLSRAYHMNPKRSLWLIFPEEVGERREASSAIGFIRPINSTDAKNQKEKFTESRVQSSME